MDTVRYYTDSIVKHIDPKRAQNRKYVDRIVNRLIGKRSSVLKARNFNTTLICMQTLDEIYDGLVEKYTVQSDVHRAEEIRRLYGLISNIDFEQFMKSGDCKPKLLYLLHKLSAGSASFIALHEDENSENRPLMSLTQFEDDACNATVCLVDWQKVLFEGDEFSVRKFDVEEDADISYQEEEQIPPSVETEPVESKTSSSSPENNDSLQSQPVLSIGNLVKNKEKKAIETEFSICNRILCRISGASSIKTSILSSSTMPVLSHLSNGSLRTSVFHLSDSLGSPLERIQSFYANSVEFSNSSCHLADIGMTCGRFLQLLLDNANDLSRSLKPVTLLSLDSETADIRRLINIFGSVLSPLDGEISSGQKTKQLIQFALSVQIKLQSYLLGCDTSPASWLLLLWFSAARPLLRGAIQRIFSPNNNWFDIGNDSNQILGQLNLQEVNKQLVATHRHLTLLRQCREEAGDFLTQARLFALPNLFEHFLNEILEKEEKFQISPQHLLSPILPRDYPYTLPVNVVDQLSSRWMEALRSECKKASTQLFEIWISAGLKSWLLAVRLVFLFQSILQLDGRNSFVKKKTPALDLLAFHMPRDVWLEFVPGRIRRSMIANCDISEANSATDTDDLTEKYANCNSVAQALELMESSYNQNQPMVLFPISLILCPDVLAKYVRVHSFLSAFHVSKNWLSRAILNNDPHSSCFGKFAVLRLARLQRSTGHSVVLTPADRLLWLLRSAVFFALSALQQYFFTSVVCANCQRLEKELETATSADDLERIHDEVMSNVVTGCLFPVGHHTYQASLRHLIVLADMLSRQQIAPKNSVKHLPVLNQTVVLSTNNHLTSDDSTLITQISGSETSWRLLSTDTCQGIRFLADTLSRSANKNHSVNRSSLNCSLFDSEFSSSSVAWLAAELQHASNIVSKQSKVLLQIMNANK